MKNLLLRSAAVAATACGIAFAAQAEDVARALVTYGNAHVTLYTIDDTGAWTKGDDIIYKDGHTTLPFRAVYRDGYLYVLDMISSSRNVATYGRLNKYSVSGEFLETVATIHGAMLDDFLFSPDGKHIYFSDFDGTNKGNIWHYDVETGATNIVVNTGGQPRQLSWGPESGYLYVADRGQSAIKKIDLATGNIANFATSNMGSVSGLYYDEEEGVFYATRTNGQMYRVASDGSSTLVGQAASNSRQVVYAAKVNGLVTGTSLTKDSYPAIVMQLKNGAFSQVLELTVNISSVCEIPLAAPVVDWKLDGAGSATEYPASGTNAYKVIPARLLQGGASGVRGEAVWFNESSYGVFEKSAAMIPATDDFAVTFWAGMPSKATFTARRTLFSNAIGASGDLSVSVGVEGHPDVLEVSFVTSGGVRLSATSSSDFADGYWHHVALCRKGTSLKAYVDGDLAAELAFPDEAGIAQTSDWCIGSAATGGEPAGSGACVDDVRLYGQSLPQAAVRFLVDEYGVAGALPDTAPALPAASSLPAELGDQIVYRRAIDASVSDSMLFKAGDGSLWLASGRGDGFRDVDRETAFFRSADNGLNWSANAAPALSAGSVSLFERDGKLFAIGLKNVPGELAKRTFAVWQLDSGAWVEKSSFAGEAGNEYALGVGAVAFYNSDSRFYKSAVCYYGGTNAYPACLSFLYNDGDFSDGRLTVKGSNGDSVIGPNPVNNQPSTCTVVDLSPGDTLIESSGHSCRAFYSFVDRPTGTKFRIGPERTRMYQFKAAANVAESTAWSLPGGSKPYSVKYDATSKLYWAVTVPVTNRQETAGVYADTVARRIGVYASPDLVEWWPCGILVESEAATFRAPSMEFCGDDMVIAYGVAANDGVGGARGFDRPNYLAARRVSNFRTALVPEKPDGLYLLAANGGSVKRYWKTSGGMWLPGKTFASGNFGGVAMNKEYGIAIGEREIYVCGEGRKDQVFVFSRKGKYLRTLSASHETAGRLFSVRIAADGRNLIVTDAYDNKAVYKVDPRSNVWTELVSKKSTEGTGDGALTDRVCDAMEMPDGTLYVASSGGLRVYDSSLNFVRKIGTATCTSLALDASGGRLFYSALNGTIYKYDLSSETSTTIQNRGTMGNNSALNLAWRDGRLLAADGRNYYAYEVNPDATNDEEVFLSCDAGFSRFDFLDENAKPGFRLLIK